MGRRGGVMGRLGGVEPGNALARGGTIGGALVVTGDVRVDGKTRLAPGNSTVVGLGFTGHADNTGLHGSTVDQIDMLRAGVLALRASSGGTSVSTTFTVNASTVLASLLRLSPEAIQTGNYQITNTDAIVFMNGTALTATLPAVGATSQLLWVVNMDAGNLTLARNGSNINGAAADLTIPGKEARLLQYYVLASTGWWVLGKA